MITGHSDVATAVGAMKAGAVDFIGKPIGSRELCDSVNRALELSQDLNKLLAWRETAASQIARLTQRQREIMEMVLAGHPSKNIATDLGISQRTVENHRASIMKKTGSKSLPALARLVLAASFRDTDFAAPSTIVSGGRATQSRCVISASATTAVGVRFSTVRNYRIAADRRPDRRGSSEPRGAEPLRAPLVGDRIWIPVALYMCATFSLVV